MRRGWALACLVLAVACGSPEEGRPLGSDEVPPPPNMLEVVCRADGSTQLLNDEVAAQPDGVHVRVDNRAGEPVSVSVADFDAGISEQTLDLAPGTAEVGCYPFSMHEGPPPPEERVEILDPAGHWVDGEVRCGGQGVMVESATLDYVAGARGEQGDPVDLAEQRVRGLEPNDEVLAVGYPEAPSREVGIVRGGDVAAVLHYEPAEDGGWLLGSYEACASAGLKI